MKRRGPGAEVLAKDGPGVLRTPRGWMGLLRTVPRRLGPKGWWGWNLWRPSPGGRTPRVGRGKGAGLGLGALLAPAHS